MTYWLEDASGQWLGDLATNAGVLELAALGGAVAEFLAEGEADAALVGRVVEQAASELRLAYVAAMLRGAEAPVAVTDGCGADGADEETKEFDEAEHPRDDAGRFADGGGGEDAGAASGDARVGFVGFRGGAGDRARAAVRDVATKFSARLLRGVVVREDKDREGAASQRGGAYHQSGNVYVNPRDFLTVVATSDMNGDRVAAPGYGVTGDAVMKDVGAHLLRQAVAHEFGHAAAHVAKLEETAGYRAAFPGNRLVVVTPTTRRYEGYLKGREEEYGGRIPLLSARLRGEQFAEAARLKVTEPKRYAKLPARVRRFVDDVWKGKK